MEYLAKVEQTLNLYFYDKAPALPINAQTFLVKYLPWITLVLFVLCLPTVLGLLGFGALIAPLAFLSGSYQGSFYIVALIVLAVQVILMGLAIPGLFKTTRQSWNLLFYSSLISVIYNLINFDLVGLIVGALISFYLLFQIRSYYKN